MAGFPLTVSPTDKAVLSESTAWCGLSFGVLFSCFRVRVSSSSCCDLLLAARSSLAASVPACQPCPSRVCRFPFPSCCILFHCCLCCRCCLCCCLRCDKFHPHSAFRRLDRTGESNIPKCYCYKVFFDQSWSSHKAPYLFALCLLWSFFVFLLLRCCARRYAGGIE